MRPSTAAPRTVSMPLGTLVEIHPGVKHGGCVGAVRYLFRKGTEPWVGLVLQGGRKVEVRLADVERVN